MRTAAGDGVGKRELKSRGQRWEQLLRPGAWVMRTAVAKGRCSLTALYA